MAQEDELKEKYLQLIKTTKEFLVVKKEEEDAISIVSLIRNTRISESIGQSLDILLMKMPVNIQEFVQSSGSLEEAEKRALQHINDLRGKMNGLSVEIKKLSVQLEPKIPSSSSEPRDFNP
ncbi:MAG: hypothetical protein ACYC7D_09930 [Nitrososphaerales archaeon]